MAARWYVVNVYSGSEKKVAESLKEQAVLKKMEDKILDVLFIATRSIADGETVEKQGFIYGKNALASDLTLENVGKSASGANSGTIKVIYNNKSSNQIGLNYGLIAMSGNIGARAFDIAGAFGGEGARQLLPADLI
mgnify:CR=1 FL=1